MTVDNSHNSLIQQEFTKQAEAYAANPTIIDPDWALRLVQAAQPTDQDTVLEVATGPGYVALAFAQVAKTVVGIDLTAAPLAIAEKNKRARNLTNLRFEAGDASQLTFADASFDMAVCRLAVHHFANPKAVMAEMTRVCRAGGKIVVEDLISSEHSERAAYYNRWERLRDPSHTTTLSLTEIINIFSEVGLEVIHIQMEDRTQVVEQWLENSQTPVDKAAEVRRLLVDDRQQNLSGIAIFYNATGQLCFNHRMATIVGQKI